jgi:hypothetical protein
VHAECTGAGVHGVQHHLEQPFVQDPRLPRAGERKHVAGRQRGMGDDVFAGLEVPKIIGVGQGQPRQQQDEQGQADEAGLAELEESRHMDSAKG